LAEVHRFPELRREFITDGDRSALRATWHNDAGFVVVSLWRGETCVATSHLTPNEAGRLATFITGGLAELATEGLSSAQPVARLEPRAAPSARIYHAVKRWRERVALSLERIARRIK
jgi:hypothetical protein